MKFHRARYESLNYQFEGFGKTKAEALKILKKALRLHDPRKELEIDWYTPDDFGFDELELGVPYRDFDAMNEAIFWQMRCQKLKQTKPNEI